MHSKVRFEEIFIQIILENIFKIFYGKREIITFPALAKADAATVLGSKAPSAMDLTRA